MYVYRNIEAS